MNSRSAEAQDIVNERQCEETRLHTLATHRDVSQANASLRISTQLWLHIWRVLSSSPSKENAFTSVPALVPTVSTTSCERWPALPLPHETDVDVDQAVVEQMLLASCAETE